MDKAPDDDGPSTCRTCGVPIYRGATTCREHSLAGAGAGAGAGAWAPAGGEQGPGSWSRAPSGPGSWESEPAPAQRWAAPPPAAPRGADPTPWPSAPAPIPPSGRPGGPPGGLRPARAGGGLRKPLKVAAALIGGLMLFGALFPAVTGTTSEDRARKRVEDYLTGDGQKAFFAPDAQFRASFPGYPERTVQEQDVLGNSVTVTSYSSGSPDREFGIAVIDTDAGVPFDLVGAVNGAAAGVGGRVETSTITTFGGHEAAEALISTPQGMFVKALIVSTATRGYTLMVVGRDNPPAGYDAFKASFQITV